MSGRVAMAMGLLLYCDQAVARRRSKWFDVLGKLHFMRENGVRRRLKPRIVSTINDS
jgi:hypothetical protein